MNDNLRQTANEILTQISNLTAKLGDKNYAMPLETLSGNSIGKHVRHILEFFGSLVDGYAERTVNYDKRKRDEELETSCDAAVAAIKRIHYALAADTRMMITLTGSYEQDQEESYKVITTFYRELVYNIEHAIHHMAIIRIAVKIEFPYLSLPPGFGIAYSTLKHQEKSKACAQ